MPSLANAALFLEWMEVSQWHSQDILSKLLGLWQYLRVETTRTSLAGGKD